MERCGVRRSEETAGSSPDVIELDQLNSEQRAVVQQVDGPLLVLAGAGSGKTRTLTYRIAHILDQKLASPHGILAITFTRKAAWEMRRRLEDLVGPASADITAVTFHSLGYKILCAESGTLGYKPEALAICDAAQAHRLLKQAMKETGVDEARWDVAQIAEIIERAKDNLYSPSAFVQVKGDFFQKTIAKVYARYEQLLKTNNAVDYGNMIRLSVQVLREHPQTLAFYQQLFHYVSVDEFQDSSFGQYQLVRHLVWGHRNLCCVGSPVQAIYSWRGADIANMLKRFREDFPRAPRAVLHTNYRSTATILAAAQQVVHALPYREELTTENGPGDPVALVSLHTDQDEAIYIVAEIDRLVQQAHYRFEDCAVLFRTRSQGRLFEQVLMHRGLPYTLVGDFRFFERKEIKDLLAYLRLIHDREDAGALQRIINRPPRGLGSAALTKLQNGASELTFAMLENLAARNDLPERVKEAGNQFHHLIAEEFAGAAKERSLPDLIDHVVVHSGYQEWVRGDSEAKERLANLAQLRLLSQRYAGVAEALSSFLADIATMGNEESGIPLEAQGVTLATFHAVKGLEFPFVFLAGLVEGIFPHARALKTPGGIEEEERLAYVAMTRAMRKLYLSYARSRQAGTSAVECTPSRFLARIPLALLEKLSASQLATITPAPPKEETGANEEEQEALVESNLVLTTTPGNETVESTEAVAPTLEVEPEFDRWLAEGQTSWNSFEAERADEIERWFLSEQEGDDTDLEAEILGGEEIEISASQEDWLAEGQSALLAFEMQLAESTYERERAKRTEAPVTMLRTQASTKSATEEKEKDETDAEDFDALLREYADEITEHAKEKQVPAKSQRVKMSYAVAGVVE
jgi:DNA helicase II / ATP-dependent DNA helicase PcrA